MGRFIWHFGVGLLLLALAACDDGQNDELSNRTTGWSADQQAAYDRCLEENMAVATAWEIIEQQCRDRIDGGQGNPLLPVE